jgi:hypothetical protein
MVASFSGSSISSPREWIDQRLSAATHAADQLAACGLHERQHQERERRSAAFLVATLIRHASRDQAPAVLPLAVTVIEPSFRTSLMPTIGRTPLLPPGSVPTALGAVPLAAVARPAHVEHRTARLGSAEALS